MYEIPSCRDPSGVQIPVSKLTCPTSKVSWDVLVISRKLMAMASPAALYRLPKSPQPLAIEVVGPVTTAFPKGWQRAGLAVLPHAWH